MNLLARTLKFCVIVLTLARSSSADAKCNVQTGLCSCSTNEGDIDLRDLDRPENPLKWTGKQYIYTYNPCTGFMCGLDGNTAVCKSNYSSSVIPVGYQKLATFKYDDAKGMNYIEYNATSASSQVYLVCNPKESGMLISGPLESTTTDLYQFTLSSKSCCPVRSEPSGLSVGSILLIVFFSLVFAYFVGGMLFMHFVRHESGVNLIPNVQFWIGLPALIRDGCVFTYSAIATLLTGRNRQGYSTA